MFIQERLHDYIYINLHRLHRYRSPLCSHLFTHFGLFLELKSKVTGNPAKRVSFSLALSPWWFACCRQGLALSRWVVESLRPDLNQAVCWAFADSICWGALIRFGCILLPWVAQLQVIMWWCGEYQAFFYFLIISCYYYVIFFNCMLLYYYVVHLFYMITSMEVGYCHMLWLYIYI